MNQELEDYLYRPCASLGEAANKAAELLPKGYRVLIYIEKDGYNVALEDPQDEERDIDFDGLVGDVNEAIRLANGITS